MPKKRKKYLSNARSKRRTKPRQITPASARASLDAGRFREAIADFKDLLRREPDPDAKLGLIDAYAGRAKQLAAKGMDREALVMWENRARLGDVPVSSDHARLLLRLGRAAEVVALYQAPDGLMDRDSRQLIGAHLGARYLAHDPTLDQVLAADDPLLVHGAAARQALEAYCSGDDAAVAAALGVLPFRSPYRDLVQVLKGLQRVDDAPEESKRLLARVGDDSAFADLRRAAELAMVPDDELADRLRGVAPAVRDLVFALRGWSAERQALWLELKKLGDPPAPKQLLSVMYRNRQAIGETWVRQRGLRLLLSNDSDSEYWLSAMHAKPLSTLERFHLEALDSEIEHDPDDIVAMWQQYSKVLRVEKAAEHGSDHAMRIALALRRPGQVLRTLDRPNGSRDRHWDSLVGETLSMLEESLKFDPEDRAAYLMLIGHFRQSSQLKDARRILKQAQQQWPRDKHILIAAMETALAGGAFKKGATIAREILAVDPINSGVRGTLIDAHVSHARKHLRGGRPDLAAKSLQEAEEWIRDERARERLDLVQGFVKLAVDGDDGEADLKRLAGRYGGGLEARLVIALEAARSSRRGVKGLLRKLGLLKAPKVEMADLLAFFTRLREELDGGAKLAAETTEYFSKPLKSAARLKLDKGQVEATCETLRRAGMDDVRLTFAQTALRRWPGEPVFQLHAVAAKYAEWGLMEVTNQDRYRLEEALERAQDAGDMRIVHGIRELLQKITMPFGMPFGMPPHMPFDIDFDDDDDDDDEDLMGSPIDALMNLISVLGTDRVRDMLNADGPFGNILRELERTIGKSQLRALIESLSDDVEDDAFDPFADPWPTDPPKPRRPARSKVKPKPKVKPRLKSQQSSESSDPDDDGPSQTDLFE